MKIKMKKTILLAIIFVSLSYFGSSAVQAASCSGTCYPVVCPEGTSSGTGTCTDSSYVCCSGTATNQETGSTSAKNTSSTGTSSSSSTYQNQEKIPGASKQQTEFIPYLKDVINFGFAIIGILALFMLVIGAYQYLMAAGNIGKVDAAKETIGSALLGLILGLCAWIILNKINPDLVNFRSITQISGTSSTSSGSGTGNTGTAAGANTGKCIAGTGNCSEDQLSCFGSQAKNASIVCNAESGGSAGVGSGTDKCGGSSASWGVMQINVTCHNIGGYSCTSAVSCCYDNKSCNASTCTIKDQATFDKCVAAASNSSTNISAACSIYKKSGWGQWGAAGKCGIS
jgi:hypothetical protein